MEAAQAAASASEAEPAVLAAVTLTRGDAVKLEDAEVVCLWKRKLEILGIGFLRW